jgi:2,3-dimethylmalate lyase
MGSVQHMKEVGYSAQIQPLAATFAAFKDMKECMQVWQEDGAPQAYTDRMMTFQELTELIGIPEITELEEKYPLSGSTLIE